MLSVLVVRIRPVLAGFMLNLFLKLLRFGIFGLVFSFVFCFNSTSALTSTGPVSRAEGAINGESETTVCGGIGLTEVLGVQNMLPLLQNKQIALTTDLKCT